MPVYVFGTEIYHDLGEAVLAAEEYAIVNMSREVIIMDVPAGPQVVYVVDGNKAREDMEA